MRPMMPIAGLLVLMCLAGAVRAGEPAGLVIAVTPGVFVERDGGREPLQVKSPIFVSDVVVTDAAGKVQILFSDDTNISVGPDTRVSVREFAGENSPTPVFKAGVESGIVRFVTGKIVERNRSGFHIQTPQATIGIRGTTFSVQVSGGDDSGKTMVIGHHVTEGFPISVVNDVTGSTTRIEISGRAVVATPAGNTEQAAPSGHLSQAGAQVRQQSAGTSEQSSETASAASQGVSTGGQGASESLGLGTASAGALSSDGTLTGGETVSSAVLTRLDGDPGMSPTALPGSAGDLQETTNPSAGSGLTARYSGTLLNNNLWVGTFSLDANVSSGQVDNAALRVTGSNLINFTAEGGSGSIAGNKKFHIDNFTVTDSPNQIFREHGSAWMDGKFNGPNDSKVNGEWGSAIGPLPIHNDGTFGGRVEP